MRTCLRAPLSDPTYYEDPHTRSNKGAAVAEDFGLTSQVQGYQPFHTQLPHERLLAVNAERPRSRSSLVHA